LSSVGLVAALSGVGFAAVQTDGPLVGAVTDTSARIFMRTSSRASVAVQYSTDPLLVTFSSTPGIFTDVTADFTMIVKLTGLAPSTKYYYRVTVGGVAQQSSPYPFFTTFPSGSSSQTFDFVVMADLDWLHYRRPAPVYATVAAANPAFILQIGDFDHRDPATIKSMRTMHREVRGYNGFPGGVDFKNNIAGKFPLFHVWDDHDYGVNDGDKTFPGRADAWKAFKEYYPLPDLPNSGAGIWHSFKYAQCEFFMLDLRSQRDRGMDTDGPNKSMLDGDKISNDQKDWLKDGLRNSTAKWKFVISSVPWNPTAKPRPPDAWASYQTERNELLDYIDDNNIEGVIFFSGDLHSGGGIDDGTYSGLPEVAVPHSNMDHGDSGRLGNWSEGIVSGDLGGGYVIAHVKKAPDRVTLEVRDVTGALRISWEATP
jgi:alkaline phosphatase D